MLPRNNMTFVSLLVACAGTTAFGQIIGDAPKSSPQDMQTDWSKPDFGIPADMPPLDQIPPIPMPMVDGIAGFDPKALA